MENARHFGAGKPPMQFRECDDSFCKMDGRHTHVEKKQVEPTMHDVGAVAVVNTLLNGANKTQDLMRRSRFTAERIDVQAILVECQIVQMRGLAFILDELLTARGLKTSIGITDSSKKAPGTGSNGRGDG